MGLNVPYCVPERLPEDGEALPSPDDPQTHLASLPAPGAAVEPASR